MVRENRPTVDQLVYPLFLLDGKDKKVEITSLPGQFRLTEDHALRTIEQSLALGIDKFMLFPVVEESLKDKEASYGVDSSNFYLQMTRKIKSTFPEVCLISDIAMDPYSSDGHDGLVEGDLILNDETLPILADMAVAQAEAGFDYVGPSDMMDGRIGYIREELDDAGFTDCGIMAYTAKYASAFYGPFRDALASAPKSGDKKTYQMDPANRKEALLEAMLDEEEGADILMVKPAIHYLDVISDLRDNSQLPIAAYQVSGECAMLLAAAEKGWLDLDSTILESATSITRAGANIIITYFAPRIAELLKG